MLLLLYLILTELQFKPIILKEKLLLSPGTLQFLGSHH